MLEEIKSKIIQKKNEAVSSLVNGNPADYAACRYLQGLIHSYDNTLLMIKQLEEEDKHDESE